MLTSRFSLIGSRGYIRKYRKNWCVVNPYNLEIFYRSRSICSNSLDNSRSSNEAAYQQRTECIVQRRWVDGHCQWSRLLDRAGRIWNEELGLGDGYRVGGRYLHKQGLGRRHWVHPESNPSTLASDVTNAARLWRAWCKQWRKWSTSHSGF